MKKVVLLGSTGSIGTSTCKVVEDLPNDLELIGLAAGRNVNLLREQVAQFNPQMVSVMDPAAAKEFVNEFNGTPNAVSYTHLTLPTILLV